MTWLVLGPTSLALTTRADRQSLLPLSLPTARPTSWRERTDSRRVTTCILISTFGCQARMRSQEPSRRRRVHSRLQSAFIAVRDKIACGEASGRELHASHALPVEARAPYTVGGGWHPLSLAPLSPVVPSTRYISLFLSLSFSLSLFLHSISFSFSARRGCLLRRNDSRRL